MYLCRLQDDDLKMFDSASDLDMFVMNSDGHWTRKMWMRNPHLAFVGSRSNCPTK